MSNPFDYFDKIVCICGQHEPERWERVQSEFEKVGILDRVERFDEVIDGDWLSETYGDVSEWGITSYCHYKIILDAYENGLKNVFIFESDVYFVDLDLELMSKSLESLDDVDWKLFYMGGAPHNVRGVINEHLVHTTMSQAHAYAVNGKYCKEIADKLIENRVVIDQVYKREKKYGLVGASYASYPRFVSQELEDFRIPRDALPHRQLVSDFKWEKLVEPMMELYEKNIRFLVSDISSEGKLHRVITTNFKLALYKNAGVRSLPMDEKTRKLGYAELYSMKYLSDYEKLDLIHSVLAEGKICFFSDSDIVFLKSPIEYLSEQIEKYDFVVQSNAQEREELTYFKKVVNPGFCMVRPTELTLKLFDTSEECDPLYSDFRKDELYINSKLNSSDEYYKNLKIKILDEDQFSLSRNHKDENSPYIIHYNEDRTFQVHPRTKIKKMREHGAWVVHE